MTKSEDAKIFLELLENLVQTRRELVFEMARELTAEPDRAIPDQAIIALTAYTQQSIAAVEAVIVELKHPQQK